MDCRNTMTFKLQKDKRIGQVLFIVEGEKTEPNLIYKVFSGILGYQMDRLYRNGSYRVFHRTDDPYSKVTVINTEESNIRFIAKDNEFLNNMFQILIEDYHLDIDNAAIYYLFDRDPESNTDEGFVRQMLSSLSSARDNNVDMTRQGLLLLSYPCIESFVGMNLLDNSIQYCWTNAISSGAKLKQALGRDGLIQNNIDSDTLLHCTEELIRSLALTGVDTNAEPLLQSLNQFADNNMRVLNWQEAAHAERGQYGLLSLLAIALLDLGLIQIDT